MYSTTDKRRKSAGHDLAYRMWSTKASRFQADERCKKTAKLSTFAVAFLSLEVIAINLIKLSGILEKDIDGKFIAVFTLILSIFILIFSIFENAKAYSTKAVKYHSCGLEINKLYNELKRHLSKNGDEDFNDEKILADIENRYESTLDKYENHQNIDFQEFLLDRKKDFNPSTSEIIGKRINIYFRSKLIYHALILVGPLLVFLYNQL